jgi:hypothetical protein
MYCDALYIYILYIYIGCRGRTEEEKDNRQAKDRERHRERKGADSICKEKRRKTLKYCKIFFCFLCSNIPTTFGDCQCYIILDDFAGIGADADIRGLISCSSTGSNVWFISLSISSSSSTSSIAEYSQ